MNDKIIELFTKEMADRMCDERIKEIKFEITREKAPIYTMSNVEPKSMEPYTARFFVDTEAVQRSLVKVTSTKEPMWAYRPFEKLLRWIERKLCQTSSNGK